MIFDRLFIQNTEFYTTVYITLVGEAVFRVKFETPPSSELKIICSIFSYFCLSVFAYDVTSSLIPQMDAKIVSRYRMMAIFDRPNNDLQTLQGEADHLYASISSPWEMVFLRCAFEVPRYERAFRDLHYRRVSAKTHFFLPNN